MCVLQMARPADAALRFLTYARNIGVYAPLVNALGAGRAKARRSPSFPPSMAGSPKALRERPRKSRRLPPTTGSCVYLGRAATRYAFRPAPSRTRSAHWIWRRSGSSLDIGTASLGGSARHTYLIQTSVTINRPIEEVFRFMTDNRNALQWQSGLLEARVTNDVVGVGKTWVDTLQILGRRIEIASELIE